MLGFRVWNNESKAFLACNDFTMDKNGNIGHQTFKGEFDYDYPELIPMQSTGIHDREGDLIYEGDILESLYNEKLYLVICAHFTIRSYHSLISYFVYGSDIAFRATQDSVESLSLPVRIIGNKFENDKLWEKVNARI